MRRRLPPTRPQGTRGMLSAIATGISAPRADVEDRFERELSAFLGVQETVLFPRGNAALAAALGAMGTPPGAAIIVPALTYVGVPASLAAEGYRPMPVDVRERDGNIDPAGLEALARHRPGAILATHLLGNAAPMPEIIAWASGHGVAVIEDCAHAIGATLDGRMLGSWGRAGFASFAVFKPVSMNGGGALFTSDEGVAANARVIGRGYPREGLPGSMVKIAAQAALLAGTSETVYDTLGVLLWRRLFTSNEGIAAYKTYIRPVLKRGVDADVQRVPNAIMVEACRLSLQRHPQMLARRRDAMRRFVSGFTASQAEQILFVPDPGCESSCQYLYIKPADRTAVVERLNRAGVSAVIPSSMFWVGNGGHGDEAPVARSIDRRTIMLPFYDGMADAEVDMLARAVRDAV